MIEQIISEVEVTTILSLKDDNLKDLILKPMGMSLVEWVQFLTDHLKNQNNIGLFGIKENGKIQKYLVAINASNPPLSKSCVILYHNFFRYESDINQKEIDNLFIEIKSWAKKLNLTNIISMVENDELYYNLGFKPGGRTIIMEI